MFFLDWGQDGVDNKPDQIGTIIFMLTGIDHNWRDSFSDSVPDPTKLYLARILADDDLQGFSRTGNFGEGRFEGGSRPGPHYGDLSREDARFAG